jgi:hypothetical protein
VQDRVVGLRLQPGRQLGGADQVAEQHRQTADLAAGRPAGDEQVAGIEVAGLGGQDLAGQITGSVDVPPVERCDGTVEQIIDGRVGHRRPVRRGG